MSVAWPAAVETRASYLAGGGASRDRAAVPSISCDPWKPVLIPRLGALHPSVLPCPWLACHGWGLPCSLCPSCSCLEKAGLIYPRPASVSTAPSPAQLGRAFTGPGRGVLKPEYSPVSFHIVYSGPGFLKWKELSFARPLAALYVLGGLVGG